MAITLLSSTTFEGSSGSFNCPSGDNRVMVVTLSSPNVVYSWSTTATFNGVSMTRQISDSACYGFGGGNYNYCNTAIFTLVNPDVGNYTVSLSDGGHIAVMVFSGTSQLTPAQYISNTAFASFPPKDTLGTGYWGMNFNGSFPPNVNINVYNVNAYGDTGEQTANRIDTYHTKVGNYASYWIQNTYNPIQHIWYNDSSYYLTTAPKYTMCGIYLKQDPSFSINETMAVGDTGFAVKGFLIQVADSILTSETVTYLKQIFISINDTINIKNRGWFGRVIEWVGSLKSSSTWTKQNKN